MWLWGQWQWSKIAWIESKTYAKSNGTKTPRTSTFDTIWNCQNARENSKIFLCNDVAIILTEVYLRQINLIMRLQFKVKLLSRRVKDVCHFVISLLKVCKKNLKRNSRIKLCIVQFIHYCKNTRENIIYARFFDREVFKNFFVNASDEHKRVFLRSGIWRHS